MPASPSSRSPERCRSVGTTTRTTRSRPRRRRLVPRAHVQQQHPLGRGAEPLHELAEGGVVDADGDIVVLTVVDDGGPTAGVVRITTGFTAGDELTFVGVGAIAVSGWLGGEMVHVHGVGVEGRE